VAGLARFPNVAVMSDEIYDHMVYDGETHVCLLTYPELRDRLILLNGWSKDLRHDRLAARLRSLAGQAL